MIAQPYGFQYEHVAASATNQVLGGTGAKGDYLHRVIVTVTTALTSQVTLLDDGAGHVLVPANTPLGIYSIDVGALSAVGAWGITTAAGVEVVAVGIFSA